MSITRRLLLAFTGFLSLSLVLPAAFASGKEPVLSSASKAWVLIDGSSGYVMSERKKELALNPGDLVHLMVLYTALEAASKNEDALQAAVSISPADVARASSARRLYLVPGEPHPLKTLLHGIAVTGAEDAVLAVAAHFSTEENSFVQKMNETAKALNLTQSRFVSAVDDDGNRMSAYDLALLTLALKQRFPRAYSWFAEKEFSFASHSLRNRNPLLWRGVGISGVMSNRDNTSLVASWHRDGDQTVLSRDVVAVLLEGDNADLTTADAQALLQYGRLDYETLRLFPAGAPITKIDILAGNQEKLEVGSPKDIWVTVRRQDIVARGTGGFATRFEYMSPAVAPVKSGEAVGRLRIYFQDRHVADFTLVALHDVGSGSFFNRFVDSVRLRMKPDGSGAAAYP